jgi:hypothetical protein
VVNEKLYKIPEDMELMERVRYRTSEGEKVLDYWLTMM